MRWLATRRQAIRELVMEDIVQEEGDQGSNKKRSAKNTKKGKPAITAYSNS
jgi:ribosomal protein L19E